ncbi:MAG: FliH/SctL family protein [Desulfonauticus sp.]|nr:FliH/SctL family protein [Desulfonauticus sp.]
MSLSNSERIPRTKARVIIGLQARELEELEGYSNNLMSPEEIEKKILERATQKAEQKAKEILTKAIKEAEDIRNKAFQEGYAKGQAEAQKQVIALKKDLENKWITFFRNLEQEKKTILANYKQDLVLLVRKCVEKIVNFTLDKEYEKIIERLFTEALEFMQSKQELKIKVNPQDKELILEILNKTKEHYPELNMAQVKEEAQVEPGGVVVENGTGLVENQVQVRLKEIDKLLAQLSLEE